MSEATVAAPCSWHDEGAVQALLDGQRPRLLAMFSRYRIPPEDVEDLLQQALLALVYQQDRIRKPGSWLIGTVRNCCRTYWAERRKQVYEAVDEKVLDEVAADDGTDQERDDLRRDLSQLVAELPPRMRELIRLRYLLGYESGEAAAALGYSPASVSKTTLRAFARLSRRLVARRSSPGGGPAGAQVRTPRNR